MHVAIDGNLMKIGTKTFALNQVASVDTKSAYVSNSDQGTRLYGALPFLWPVSAWLFYRYYTVKRSGAEAGGWMHVLVLRTGGGRLMPSRALTKS
jgi:hypothetical protein